MALDQSRELSKTIFSVLILQVTFSVLNVKADFNHSSQLHKKFITDLDHRVRPSLNASIPTDVNVSLHIISLREIVETHQFYMLNIWMEFYWKDEIRQWDPAEHGGVKVIYPYPGDTWIPRVLISNSVEKRDLFSDDHTLHGIFYDGTTRWYPGSVISAGCTLDLTYFPFDSQICTLRFIPQSFEWDVNLVAAQDGINTSGYARNCEWRLESTSIRKTALVYDNLSLGSMYFDFRFSRRPTFYLVNVFAPVAVMSLLAPLVFVLPEESGERVSYSVTLLLSMTVFLSFVSEKLPTCSEPLPLTVTYIFAMLIHSGLCVVCTVFQLRFIQNHKDQAGNQQREDENAGLIDAGSSHQENGNNDHAKKLDDNYVNDHIFVTDTMPKGNGQPRSGNGTRSTDKTRSMLKHCSKHFN
ncbi:hypothetical protein EGW08_004038 [Elysia chlorotica]|uniref:Neurotransmitter-gated ion-channel ligand-binding domain-containing protein n=1 Tax=Elysia chlorotica TaxID=188477 RepID=A0A3S1BTA7_ELYCH|nr:hypothetical protein EGW08_004038 [Elysia chlorotica]